MFASHDTDDIINTTIVFFVKDACNVMQHDILLVIDIVGTGISIMLCH